MIMAGSNRAELSNTKHRVLPGIPKVYSYLRFSTPEQLMGDSERRQLDMARAWVERKGWGKLDDTLQMADRGLSGYHGQHRKKGALGQFLHRVENGEVPQGSYLLVENIDRLSRENVVDTLREIIFKLWDYGITLQTLSPEETYEPGCADTIKFSGLWMFMQIAHSQSKEKSIRIRAARKKARENAYKIGTQLTARCPAWLKPVKEEGTNKNELKITFEPIPEAAETIKQIFDLKLKGVGKGTIARRLNTEAAWKPIKGNGWRASYVKKILNNPAVIGQCQFYERNKKTGKREPVGRPILNYFPPVVDENTFYAVQKQLEENKGKGGRTGLVSNLFTHLAKCAYCGGSMRFVDKGKPPKGRKYLVCDNGEREHKCSHRSIHYDECETVILENCKGLKPDEVLPSVDNKAKLCALLRKRIQGYIGQLKEYGVQKKNYLDQIGRTNAANMRDSYEKRVLEIDELIKKISGQKTEDESKLQKTESGRQSVIKWGKDLTSLLKGLEVGDVELRMRLRSHLCQLIEKIEIFTVGKKELYDGDKDDGKLYPTQPLPERIEPSYRHNAEEVVDKLYSAVSESHPKFVRSKAFRTAVEDIKKRRMSKEGRFLRLYFKTGRFADIVPKGSIACGKRLTKEEDYDKFVWEYIEPCYDLLTEYIGEIEA